MSQVKSVVQNDSSSSLSSDEDRDQRSRRVKRNVRNPVGVSRLDSNGESNGESDDEVDKLQRIVTEKTKELNEEKQITKKVFHITFFSVREKLALMNNIQSSYRRSSVGACGRPQSRMKENFPKIFFAVFIPLIHPIKHYQNNLFFKSNFQFQISRCTEGA